MRSARVLSLLFGAAFGACATGTPLSKVATTVDQSLSEGQPGYQLAIQAIGCWSGWLWAEAEGYLPPERRAVTEVRCRQVLRKAFNDGQGRYDRMRDMDPALVEELAQKVAPAASADERDAVVKLLRVAADAEREAMEARRAARKVRRDLNDPKELTTLEPEEVALLRELHDNEALERLLKADLGPLTEDARLLGLLVMVGRVESVRLLPRHLRPHAVEAIGKLIFGPEMPPLEEDLSKPLSHEASLQYLAEVARRAGHPLPEGTTHPTGRSLLAFSGILKGLADRIHQAEARLSKDAAPTLRRIAKAVAGRLDQEYSAAQGTAARPQGGPQRPAGPS